MSTNAWMLIFRLVHILSAIFWGGAALTITYFLLPSMRAAGPDGQRFMQRVMAERKLQVFVMVAAIFTVLSGFVMYGMHASAGNGWAGSRMGITLGIGGLAGLLAVVVGLGINGRAGKRMMVLAQEIATSGGQPTSSQAAEMQTLQDLLRTGAAIASTLIVIAMVTMAIARYV